MSVCLSTVVDKEYIAYLPLFVYCANKVYPDYHIRLFLRDPCPYNLKAWKLNCETVPLFENFPRYKYASIALRFVIDRSYYSDFDYVYITDIDMMIMRENKDIETFHCLEMQQTGLCYSNSLRNASHYEGSQSLTGLHFASKEWFKRTNDIVDDYRKYMEAGLIGLYREFDGVMLYRIAQRSGLGLPGKYKLASRHHGVHLANFRLFPNDKLKLETRISNDFKMQWVNNMSNKIFQDIITVCKEDNEELKKQLSMLDGFILGRM